MVNVAIAGGTGGVGRTILEILNESPKHKAFVLSRKQSTNSGTTIMVDYNDVEQLTSVLETNKIHTIISAFPYEGDSLVKSQLNLIEAAIMSKETKRFVPSVFAIPYPERGIQELPLLKDYFKAIEVLKQSNLEWTIFLNGIFLDYFGGPDMKTYLKPNIFVIDLANKVAAVPGDGNVPVTFTYTFDLARFVVAALDVEKWPQESRVIGDELTWNEFVRLAEEVQGSEFDVYYDDIEKLKRYEITELPGHVALYTHYPKKVFQRFMSTFELWTADGTSCIPKKGSLNELFPDIKTLTVREMLELYWKEH